MKTVEIPASVTILSPYSFRNCEKIRAINVKQGNAIYKSVDGIVFNEQESTLLSYPAGKEDTSYTIPSGIGKIEEGAFYGCKNLTKVILPEGVKKIGQSAFYQCKNLNEVSFPNTLEFVDVFAFADCTKLLKVYIPGDVVSTQKTENSQKKESGIADWAFGLYEKSKNVYRKLPDFTIYGKKGSESERYAEKHRFLFKDINDSASGDEPKNTTTPTITPIEPKDDRTTQTTVQDTGKTGSASTTGNSTSWGGYVSYPAVSPTTNNSFTASTPTVPAQNTGTVSNNTINNTSTNSPTQENNATTATQSAKTSITTGTGSNKLTFKIASDNNHTVSLSNVPKAAKRVIVPSTVKDAETGITYQVTSVAKGALKSHTKLKSVVISGNVKTIGASAFYGCKNLSDITIYGNSLGKVGKNAFKGIKKGAVVKVEAKNKAHYNKIKAILKKSGVINVKYKYRFSKK